jgi:DNA segregation ATPase FtsK/SpoIIIE-like protein
MTKDEALKLALKALRFAGDDGYQNEVSQQAITAIKQALAAPVQEPVAIVDEDGVIVVCNYKYKPGDKLYTTPPAAPVPLTDDSLQGAVDWLLQADGEYFCTATVQRTLRIGYNRAKRLCDTAKERAAHGIAAAPAKGQP